MRSFPLRYGVLLLSAAACAQTPTTTTTTETKQVTTETPVQATTTTTTRQRIVETGKTAGHIATQPARDVGAEKVQVPAAVQKAAAAPYALAGLNNCVALTREIASLDDVLGPDFDTAAAKRESRAGKLAEAGGKTVVNTIIPFRGLVRELTGAAPAERRLNAALDASYARRGFLRGVAAARRCRR
jgi:hypothetical protein